LPYSRTADLSRAEFGSYYEDGGDLTSSEQRQAEYRNRIEKEEKIKIGTENLLEALNSKKEKQVRDQRKVVETELNTSNRKIAQLKLDLEAEIQRSKETPLSPKGRLSQLFRSAPLRSPEGPGQQLGESEDVYDPELESPTYILAEILQAL
jgi:dsDNA-specific endonuclease/ATPase MutS2